MARNAGRSNAFTGNEETCYYFTVNQDSLEGALDIYSQFFVAPLFSASGVEREINAVNSENAKNLNTDSWRISQTLKLRNNQLHPIAKFGTGNNETLARTPKKAGVDVQKELRSFYKRYYSANQMTLAVSGRQDLDTLQSWVTDLFSQVPNTDVPPAEAEYAGKISPIQPGAEDFVFGVESVLGFERCSHSVSPRRPLNRFGVDSRGSVCANLCAHCAPTMGPNRLGLERW